MSTARIRSIVHVPTVELAKATPTTLPDFREASVLRVSFSGAGGLTADERTRLAQIVGYAFQEKIRPRGEHIGDGRVLLDPRGVAFLDVPFGSSARSDSRLAWQEFTEAVVKYVKEGTPVRTTNRAGAGTKGTRVVEPLQIGALGTLSFWVDVVVERPTKIELDLSDLSQRDVESLLAMARDFGIVARQV